jgi:hypothetical protein
MALMGTPVLRVVALVIGWATAGDGCGLGMM